MNIMDQINKALFVFLFTGVVIQPYNADQSHHHV